MSADCKTVFKRTHVNSADIILTDEACQELFQFLNHRLYVSFHFIQYYNNLLSETLKMQKQFKDEQLPTL